MTLPRLVFTDIDGVWTDGGMYYDQTGNEWKKFNTSDSAGVLFLKRLNIPVCIITGEKTEILRRRAEKLNVTLVYQGISDKLSVAQEVCREMGIDLSETAHIGDDIGDIQLLSAVGFSAAPSNSPDYIKKIVHHVTNRAGGAGAFREFAEYIIVSSGISTEFFLSGSKTA